MSSKRKAVERENMGEKWQLVILEFEDSEEHLQKAVTKNLEKIGLICLQKNVFVCPYDCDDAVNFISASHGTRENTKIMTFDNVEKLKAHLWSYYETHYSCSFVNNSNAGFDIL